MKICTTVLALAMAAASGLLLVPGKVQATVMDYQATIQGLGSLRHHYTFDGATDTVRREDKSPLFTDADLNQVTNGSASTLTYGAAGFDATSDSVTFTRNVDGGTYFLSAANVDLDNVATTVELLIRPTTVSYGDTQLAHVFNLSGSASARGYFAAMSGPSTATDLFEADLGNSWSTGNSLTVRSGLTAGHWYFYALTVENSGGNATMTGYHADLTAGETTLTATSPKTVTGTYATGSGQNFGVGGMFHTSNPSQSFLFPGSIDEAAVFDGALSQSAIQGHLDDVLVPEPSNIPEPSTLAIWALGLLGLGLFGWWRR